MHGAAAPKNPACKPHHPRHPPHPPSAPALQTSRCTGRPLLFHSLAKRRTSPRRARSRRANSALPPCGAAKRDSSSAARAPRSRLRAATTTWAPRSASWRATALPMPALPPVTIAVAPRSGKGASAAPRWERRCSSDGSGGTRSARAAFSARLVTLSHAPRDTAVAMPSAPSIVPRTRVDGPPPMGRGCDQSLRTAGLVSSRSVCSS